jgi:hypothetical protein
MREGTSIFDGAISSHVFNVIGLDFSLKQKIGKGREKIVRRGSRPGNDWRRKAAAAQWRTARNVLSNT